MPPTPDLVRRIHDFALASLKFYQRLPKTTEAQVFGRQFLESSSAVESNYLAAKRGRSRAEFISKLGTVVEEINEAVAWLELISDGNIATDAVLLSEAQQLRRILGKSLGTARKNHMATKNLRTKNFRSGSLEPKPR